MVSSSGISGSKGSAFSLAILIIIRREASDGEAHYLQHDGGFVPDLLIDPSAHDRISGRGKSSVGAIALRRTAPCRNVAARCEGRRG